MLSVGDGPNPYSAPLLGSESPEEGGTREAQVAALMSLVFDLSFPILTVLRTTLSNYRIIKQPKQ